MRDELIIMDNVYDLMFENDFLTMNFCDLFPASGIDYEEGIIYLAKNDQQNLFKITIERL